LVWTGVVLIAVLWLPLMAVVFVVTAPFDHGRYAVGRLFRLAAVACVSINPAWDFRTSGVRITDPRRPYVAVSNHESIADIFLISHLPWEMKWLSKEAVFRLPVMGWLMRMAGDIPVRRHDRGSRLAAMDGVRDRLGKRVTVMIMPEGTRSPTDELLPFRDGAFRVAVELGLPILPIAVAGPRNAIAKGSLLINKARAEVRVLPPVATEGLTKPDVAALRERVRHQIAAAREEMRAGLASTDPRATTLPDGPGARRPGQDV
jgi:1-acyl-sn-glycerol-3-phosphate acyltransferase